MSPNGTYSKDCKYYSLYYQNVRGLRSKTHSFYVNSTASSSDIIFLTETWLNDSVRDSELFSNKYCIIRRDRSFDMVGRVTGGGVLIALSSNLPFTMVNTSDLSDLVPLIDVVMCRCCFGSFSCVLACVYIPPDVSVGDLELFLDALSDMLIGENMIVVGDFNVPQNCASSFNINKATVLESFMDVLGVHQRNTVLNGSKRILDLVLAGFSDRLDVSVQWYLWLWRMITIRRSQ